MGSLITSSIFGLIFITVGIKLWQRGADLLRHGKKAKAIIFRNNVEASKKDRPAYPVVRFLTDKNEWITQELSVGYFRTMEEGTEVEVIYDPEDPTTVEINSSFTLEILPRLLGAIGLGMIVFGILSYLEFIPVS